MGLADYFASATGTGILATADAAGKVNMAVYAKPHFPEGDDGRLAFIMSDRLSHDNVVSNPQAAYLFIEVGDEYVGRRLFLTRIGEETDQAKIDALRHRPRSHTTNSADSGICWLVHFRVDGVRPLIGAGPEFDAS